MTVRVIDRDGPARLLLRDDVRCVLVTLTVAGEETRLVGGCVRDALLGRSSADLDLTTTLEPGATLSLAAKAGLRAIPTGFEHGTVTILVDTTPFEVTTLREDVETDGRHAVVRFGRDFGRDADRRDFTINALSLDPAGILHDTTGGVADLEGGRVRFIGEASTRIREDALRILRFFRFHARYGVGALDEAGLAACIDGQDALAGLSRERIREELLKLIEAPGAPDALRTMNEAGILARLIGGPANLGRLGRLLEAFPTSDATVRLAALAVDTAMDATRLQEVLRLSKAEGAKLTAYAEARASLAGHANLAGQAEIDVAAVRALVAECDAMPISEALAAMEPSQRPRLAEEALAMLDALRSGATPRPAFPIAGTDLVARGIPPGPALGQGLKKARALWLETGCPDDAGAREALLAYGLRVAGEES